MKASLIREKDKQEMKLKKYQNKQNYTKEKADTVLPMTRFTAKSVNAKEYRKAPEDNN